MKIMLGRDLIILECDSVNALLFLIEYLIKKSKDRKKLFHELLEKQGDGFRVWQELKDNYNELINP